jgi:hypothetical protein
MNDIDTGFMWGKAVGGLRLGIALSKKKIAEGKHNTVLKIGIENISAETIHLPQSNVLFDYDITCRTQDEKNIGMNLQGKQAFTAARTLPAARKTVEIAAGATYEKNHTLNLNELFELDAKEKYFLQVHLRHWPGKDDILSSGMLSFYID